VVRQAYILQQILLLSGTASLPKTDPTSNLFTVYAILDTKAICQTLTYPVGLIIKIKATKL
jgi:hypothetical protein